MNIIVLVCFAVVALTYVEARRDVVGGPCRNYCPHGRLPDCCTCRHHGDTDFPTCDLMYCGPGRRCVMKGFRPMCVPVFHPARCHLPMDQGRCLAYFPRYYFDIFAGRCLRFIYGGCEGNANRFRTLFQCRMTCGGPFAG